MYRVEEDFTSPFYPKSRMCEISEQITRVYLALRLRLQWMQVQMIRHCDEERIRIYIFDCFGALNSSGHQFARIRARCNRNLTARVVVSSLQRRQIALLFQSCWRTLRRRTESLLNHFPSGGRIEWIVLPRVKSVPFLRELPVHQNDCYCVRCTVDGTSIVAFGEREIGCV